MSKPTLMYAMILLLSAGGVWGLLRAGSHIHAVSDIAGKWDIQGGPLGPGTGGPEHLGDSFTVEQSGRFLRLKFASGHALNMKADEAPLGRIAAPATFRMSDGQRTLVATISQEGEKMSGEFQITGGRRPAQFTAVRETHDSPEENKAPKLKTGAEE